ncbi:hypothetical protein [Calothrix sp. NIES-2098]|uniref:hypothetical protein n=1 Tax=Calothrix sp. NIES-2098 TaxID=1954171 RepID=UPI000B5F7F3C|nr:hypothetical protein NIES2098_13150 [Calothrix sp. NIES-2098]
MNEEQHEQLSALLDDVGVENVIQAIAEYCYQKAHCYQELNNDFKSKTWGGDGFFLHSIADNISH